MTLVSTPQSGARWHSAGRFVAAVVGLLCASALAAAPAPTSVSGPVGLTELSRLDWLPQFRSSASVGMVSSYDRTGGNDDGFSGTYSFVRKEGDGLVIADLAGPGVIYRIWTPTPTDDPIEFYLDGEEAPRLRLPFRSLFDGTHAPFLLPLVDHGSGGNWSYVPIAYEKRCKVVMRATKVQFYQINYATYPAGTTITSFIPTAVSAAAIGDAGALLSRTGTDVSAWTAPVGSELQTTTTKGVIPAGGSLRLFEAKQGGRIVGLRLSPASAFAGKDRALTLRMHWDGAAKPAVECPVGDFFGYSWGSPSMRSLLVGTSGETCYSYFPMPYNGAATIEIHSDRAAGAPIEVTAEVVFTKNPRQANEAYFGAHWRRDNPTKVGQPFTFASLTGRGHVVGVALQAQGENNGNTPFFEGDDRAVIDGVMTHHGTGSEDFFNGGWYDVPGRWEARASYPLNGCLDYVRPLSRSGAYRFFLGDAYAFTRSLVLDIEHSPTGNTDPTDYAGVCYFYSADPQAGAIGLPAVADRQVVDPRRVVYKPGWYQPPLHFSIERMGVAKRTEKRAGEEIRFLEVRATASDLYSPHHLAFFCDVPAAGRYRVSAQTLLGPEQGTAQLFVNGHPVGEARNGRSTQREKSGLLVYGDLELQAGMNRVYFQLTGTDASAGFGLDLETLVLERQ